VLPKADVSYRLASDFIATLRKDSGKLFTMCEDLLQLRVTTTESEFLKCKYLLSYHQSLPVEDAHWSQSPVSPIVRRLGVYQTVFVTLSLLAERRIVITGGNVSDVSKAVQSFVRLLAPLTWPHTLIPIIPDSQAELCYNPTPYICGILRYNLTKVGELLCGPIPGTVQVSVMRWFKKGDRLTEAHKEEITVIDIERGIILPCMEVLSQEYTMDEKRQKQAIINHCSALGFPTGATTELFSLVKACLAHKDNTKADHKLEKVVPDC